MWWLFGEMCGAPWKCTRLLGQRSWVRIRHIPQWPWCAVGSLCNNVQYRKSQGRKGKPIALRQKKKIFTQWSLEEKLCTSKYEEVPIVAYSSVKVYHCASIPKIPPYFYWNLSKEAQDKLVRILQKGYAGKLHDENVPKTCAKWKNCIKINFKIPFRNERHKHTCLLPVHCFLNDFDQRIW